MPVRLSSASANSVPWHCGVPAEVGLLGEGEVPAGGAPAPEEGGGLVVEGEPPLDGGEAGLGR